MKTFTGKYVAQGDCNIFAVEAIPTDIPPAEKDAQGRYILAHSETGHSHVIDGNTVRVFEQDEFISFMDVEKESNVVHLRNFDTHETIKLPPGQYRISRQREYTAEGFRRAAD